MDISATAGKRIPSEEKPTAPTREITGDSFGTATAMATETRDKRNNYITLRNTWFTERDIGILIGQDVE